MESKPTMNDLLKSLCCLPLLLVSCSTTNPKMDPGLLHSSYDYTRPAEIANQSKPVWVLPIINQGWVPAKVDPHTGDWISGHYTASVVQDGHWATLEEAELAGRPYVVAGESKPVVPSPLPSREGPAEVPASSLIGGELDLTALDHRVTALEEKEAPSPRPSPESMEELSTEIQGLAQSDPHSELEIPPTSTTNSFSPQIETESTSDSTKQPAPQVTGPSIFLPGSSPIGSSTTPPEASANLATGKMVVRYLPDNVVEILFQGKTYQVHLQNPKDQIKITLPPPS